MSTPDSSSIRQQILSLKTLLQRHQASHTQILKRYTVLSEQTDFTHLDDIQIEAFYAEVNSLKSYLFQAYDRILKPHNQWQPLLDSSGDERDRFDLFIAAHGDYRETIGTSVTLLENLDLLLNSLHSEVLKRGLQILSDASVRASGRNVPVAREEPQPEASSAPAANYVVPHDNSLLNFDDASILSKLELPSFDGNLLDSPEFSERFATFLTIKGS
ncbi:hypothetical protein KIN20_019210 [Parelaphostrongylus tenuis]|uniref:Uncharacterized protein n=1 Tax=Parelaphostrongylus tenuis TaxID=148309 RepID=A0AAD5QSP0_PARTN|nr:hypothetical protein KIN20_019210 [Parelaphostrongylus tenuis]